MQLKEDGPRKEALLSLDGGEVELAEPLPGEGPLVIPCQNLLKKDSEINKAKQEEKATAKQKPLEKAVEDNEGGLINPKTSGLISKNLTKLSDEDADAVRELLKDAQKEPSEDDQPVKQKPILMRNEKFWENRKIGGSERDHIKREMEDLPETNNKMFDKVAIESFGEAMLRGMGYDPKVHTTKPVSFQQRDQKLGLGAKALTPWEKAQAAAKVQRKKEDEKAQKAKELNELNGEDKPTTEDSQAEKNGESKEVKTEVKKESAAARVAAMLGSSASSKRVKEEVKVEVKKELDEPAQKKPRIGDAEQSWVSTGLVVRLVSKRDDALRTTFGAEGVVIGAGKVAGQWRVKVRKGPGEGKILENVIPGDLETRVSAKCQEARVVRGPKVGQVVQVRERDANRGVAIVKIGGEKSEIALDKICEFVR